MVWPATNWLPSIRIAISTPRRISGSPPRAIRRPSAAASPCWSWDWSAITLPLTISAQVAALTNSEGEPPRWRRQSPRLIFSAIRRSAVSRSGIRSKASARHISATPSCDDSENSCISASTPDARLRSLRTVATRRAASAPAARRSASLLPTSDSSHCTASVSSRRNAARSACLSGSDAGRASAAKLANGVQPACADTFARSFIVPALLR